MAAENLPPNADGEGATSKHVQSCFWMDVAQRTYRVALDVFFLQHVSSGASSLNSQPGEELGLRGDFHPPNQLGEV